MHLKYSFFWTKLLLIFIRIRSGFIFDRQKRREYRAKLYLKCKKSYLHQFLYAIDKDIDGDDKITKQFNKIWVCWLQGLENAPDIVKVCIKSIQKYKIDSYEVIIIDNNNLRQYTNIPEYIYEKKEKGFISNAHFSDLVRTSLLTIHGGIWIDATVLVSNDIPNQILKSDFFAFHSKEKGFYSNNWFIKTIPGHHIIKSMRNLLFEYWLVNYKTLDYFIYHIFFNLIIEKSDHLRNMWNKVPIFWDYDSYNIGKIMYQKYNKENYDKYTKYFMQKLTYKLDKKRNLEGTYIEYIMKLI